MKKIPGYPGYYVDSSGNVYGLSGKIMRGHNHDGYMCVRTPGCKTKYTAIHRLVAIAFYGPSELSVDHKDCNTLNNHPKNLRFMSIGDNARRHHLHKMTKRCVVDKMIKMKRAGKTYQEIADKYNKAAVTIWRLMNGKRNAL